MEIGRRVARSLQYVGVDNISVSDFFLFIYQMCLLLLSKQF